MNPGETYHDAIEDLRKRVEAIETLINESINCSYEPQEPQEPRDIQCDKVGDSAQDVSTAEAESEDK